MYGLNETKSTIIYLLRICIVESPLYVNIEENKNVAKFIISPLAPSIDNWLALAATR